MGSWINRKLGKNTHRRLPLTLPFLPQLDKTKDKQEEQMLTRLTFKFKKKEKKVSVMSIKHTQVTKSMLYLIFLMYVATTHHLNYSGQESKR